MKVIPLKKAIYSRVDAEVSHAFKLGDEKVIFQLLTSQLYKYPLRTCIQEYISNAIDSHVEAGTDRKVDINFNPENNVLSIRDYGVGLSPKRVEEIFIYLGESTKRDSDDQIGGFGIGAKSGFAYTDNFTIISYYNGIKYVYLAYIDEQGLPKLDVLLTTPCDEPNGVEIRLPIKSEDISNMHKAIVRAVVLRQDKVNVNLQIKVPKVERVSDNVSVLMTHRHEFSLNWNEFIISLDGVFYPVSIDDLPSDIDLPYTYGGTCPVIIHASLAQGVRPTITREDVVIEPEFVEYLLSLEDEIADVLKYVPSGTLMVPSLSYKHIHFDIGLSQIQFTDDRPAYILKVRERTIAKQEVRSVPLKPFVIWDGPLAHIRDWLLENCSWENVNWVQLSDDEINWMKQYKCFGLIYPQPTQKTKRVKSLPILIARKSRFEQYSFKDIDDFKHWMQVMNVDEVYYVNRAEECHVDTLLKIAKRILNKKIIFVKVRKSIIKELGLQHYSKFLEKIKPIVFEQAYYSAWRTYAYYPLPPRFQELSQYDYDIYILSTYNTPYRDVYIHYGEVKTWYKDEGVRFMEWIKNRLDDYQKFSSILRPSLEYYETYLPMRHDEITEKIVELLVKLKPVYFEKIQS